MATITLATLLIKLEADNTQYKKGVKDSKEASAEFREEVKRTAAALQGQASESATTAARMGAYEARAKEAKQALAMLNKEVAAGNVTVGQAAAVYNKVEAELEDYRQELGLTDKELDKLGDGVQGTGMKWTEMASKLNLASMAFDFAKETIIEFGRESITVASDVEEAASKFQYTFGAAAEATGTELDEFAAAANRSRFEMRSMAADVGAMTESTLGSKEAAGDMSVAISQLAVDLASFNNVTEDEALTALKAGLIGEAEPMRRFGVLLSEAAVQNYILSTGMAETKAEITDSMKMQARYNLIMDQTATAQGDAIRTSDSYANVSRGLEAAIQELHAAIGENLIPSMVKAKSAATDVIGGLAGFASANNALSTAVADGIITQAEANRMTDRMALTSMDAADVMRILKTEYQQHNIAMEEMAAEAAGADQVFQRYIPTIEEVEQELGGLTDEYKAAMRVLGMHAPMVSQDTREMEEAAYASGELGNAQDRLSGYMDDAKKAAEDEAKALEEQTKRLDELKQRTADYFVEATNAEAGAGLFNESLNDLGMQYATVSGRTADQSAALGELQDAYDKAKDTLFSYEMGAKGVGLTEEDRNKKIEEQRELMVELEGAMQPLLAVQGEVISQNVQATINQDAVNAALYESVIAANASAEQIALVGLATGQLTKEQANAALTSALIQMKIDELTAAYAAGTITVGGMRSELQGYIGDLEAVPPSVATELTLAGISEARGNVRGLISELGQVPRHVRTTVETVRTESGGGKTTGSGGDAKDGKYASGGFTGGFENVAAGIVHGQEFVFSAPAVRSIGVPALQEMHNEARGGNYGGGMGAGGDTTYNFYNNTREAAALSLAVVAERRRAKLDTYMGVG